MKNYRNPPVNFIKIAFLAFLISSFGVPVSADWQKGLVAYEKGDYGAALQEWEPLAEQGDVDAQYNLGYLYDRAPDTYQDYEAALKWYTLAAEQGDANAQNNLGVMYEAGKGLAQDYKTAVKWYTRAAEQGDATAQNNLAFMYANGRGISSDYIRGFMWWYIAASLGQKDAEVGLADIQKVLTTAQVAEAQTLVSECVEKNYRNC